MNARPLGRIRHRADKINEQGGVSALCFSRPRAIDMNRASWVMGDDGVTCPKCLALMKKIGRRVPARQEHGG